MDDKKQLLSKRESEMHSLMGEAPNELINSLENKKKLFKRIYPEDNIKIVNYGFPHNLEAVIFQTEFPDGEFYFVVDENSVSSSYDSWDDALRSMNF